MASADLARLLAGSFAPDSVTRRQAERGLDEMQALPNFGQLALVLAQDDAANKPIRQSAALIFKNWVKANWALEDEAPHPIPSTARVTIKDQVVPAMLALAAQGALQIQIGEAISLIATTDFPAQWGELVDHLTSSLSQTNFIINNAVLQTAHSIFNRWRHEFRTDALFLEIKFVLERFFPTFLQLFQATDHFLSANTSANPNMSPAILSHTLYLLLELFHDFNSQDLPEAFEDNISVFMELLHKYLVTPPGFVPASADVEDEDETEAERIRGAICEIVQLYCQKYTEEFTMLDTFVQSIWTMLTSLSSSKRFDGLVSKALNFLAVVVRMPGKQSLFEDQATLEAFCQRIILPNMVLRAFEEEMFEDDPLEFIRRDIEGTAESDTRRQSASDFTRAFMERFEAPVTAVITGYVSSYLQEFALNPQVNWRSKDTAIFLLTSIAARGITTSQQGVTATNALVDVVAFFNEHVIPDLRDQPNPILTADAIKLLHAFRSQMSKDLLISVLPLLIPHLGSQSIVVHTYAALTIERILFMKSAGKMLISQGDVQPFAEGILVAALKVIESGTTPQQVAQNDAMMKCVMRVVITTRQGLTPSSAVILGHLVRVITEVSKNPSNPKFNHYAFESVSGLIRFVVAGDPTTLSKFEESLFPPFQYILQQDVADALSEFSPFVFQILSQMLELHTTSMPDTYQALVPPLLMGSLWTQRGNIPALVRLVRAFLAKGAIDPAQGHVNQLRDILRYLMPAKASDQFSLELLEAMYEHLSSSALQPILADIFILLLQRLTGGKTEKFVQGFIRTFCLLLALEKPGLGPDEAIAVFEFRIQPGIFAQVLLNIVPDFQKTPIKDRKVVLLGLIRLTANSQRMLVSPNVEAWWADTSSDFHPHRHYIPRPATFQALLKLMLLPQALTRTGDDALQDAIEEDIVVIDLEASGYQSSFSKLGASESTYKSSIDTRSVDARSLLANSLVTASQSQPNLFPEMLKSVALDFRQPFLDYLVSQNLQLH